MPIEPSSPDPREREALAAFLREAFRLGRDAPFLRPRLVEWKYEEPRPDWQGSRSYVWKDAGRIVAHACLCPVTYSLPAGEVSGSYLIDWAASRSSPGAGSALLRALARQCGVLFAVGGSPETLAILPKLGYRHSGDLRWFARPLRPWRQFRSDPFPRGWKAPLRLARNVLWRWAPSPALPPEWSAQPLAAFDSTAAPLFEARAARWPLASTRRTPELMNYFLRCPGASWSAALLLHRGVPRGWYVLSRVGGQVRLADLWVDSERSSDWTIAYSLALRSARRDPAACELVAAASIPPAIEGASRAGLQFRRSDPIFLLDPRKLLASASLNVTPIESDLAYLDDPSYPYLT